MLRAQASATEHSANFELTTVKPHLRPVAGRPLCLSARPGSRPGRQAADSTSRSTGPRRKRHLHHGNDKDLPGLRGRPPTTPAWLRREHTGAPPAEVPPGRAGRRSPPSVTAGTSPLGAPGDPRDAVPGQGSALAVSRSITPLVPPNPLGSWASASSSSNQDPASPR